jgi:hypothetical protein
VSLGKGVGSSENDVAKAWDYAGAGTKRKCLTTGKILENDGKNADI